MERYNSKLKGLSRTLRTNLTDAEQVLWQHIRRKQIQGVQFYRQKPAHRVIVWVKMVCCTPEAVVRIGK